MVDAPWTRNGFIMMAVDDMFSIDGKLDGFLPMAMRQQPDMSGWIVGEVYLFEDEESLQLVMNPWRGGQENMRYPRVRGTEREIAVPLSAVRKTMYFDHLCHSFLHEHPGKSVADALQFYNHAEKLLWCGMYIVCKKHYAVQCARCLADDSAMADQYLCDEERYPVYLARGDWCGYVPRFTTNYKFASRMCVSDDKLCPFSCVSQKFTIVSQFCMKLHNRNIADMALIHD